MYLSIYASLSLYLAIYLSLYLPIYVDISVCLVFSLLSLSLSLCLFVCHAGSPASLFFYVFCMSAKMIAGQLDSGSFPCLRLLWTASGARLDRSATAPKKSCNEATSRPLMRVPEVFRTKPKYRVPDHSSGEPASPAFVDPAQKTTRLYRGDDYGRHGVSIFLRKKPQRRRALLE